ncbi:hypothetical protein CMV_011227 [Castanea mollissima]|uniref:Uncharacterized protein n=1 Tax=Castanea mollissima TaxID=60419 RepID=A0A8J4VX36_9ROSI|nr:hypothetical protein CMV_011227 [Castanea mollissima]
MATTCLDLPQNSSNHLEDYHGRISASIPFTWESQPVIPKLQENTLERTRRPVLYTPSFPSTMERKHVRQHHYHHHHHHLFFFLILYIFTTMATIIFRVIFYSVKLSSTWLKIIIWFKHG